MICNIPEGLHPAASFAFFSLQAEEVHKEAVLKEQLQLELPAQEGPIVDKEFTFEAKEAQFTEEVGSSEVPKPDEWA